MKRPHQSRGSAATNFAEQSIDASSETTGTETENPNGSNASGAVGTIDPNDTSYFIQYQPELAEQLSQHNSKYSVSGRCLSIVASRMIYWSRYAKHRYNGKLYFWKNQTEISEETGFSVKQINRALKVLVELGILIREKFQKHRYFQCYFYHIPTSPHTKEIPSATSTTRRNRSRSTRTSAAVGSVGNRPQQQFHRALAAPARVVEPIGTAPCAVGSGAPAPVPSGGAGFASKTTSTIHKSRRFRTNGTNCPDYSIKTSSSIKQSLLSIMERCISYGQEDIYRDRFHSMLTTSTG